LLAVSAAGWVACQGVPDEDNGGGGATLVVNVSSPHSGDPEADPGAMTVEKFDPEAEAETAAAPGKPMEVSEPASDVWALRISLTNPTEVFIVRNWVGGTPVRLTVTPGTGRLLDVQAYLIPGMISPQYFPAYHYYTITPAGQRLLDLTESTKTVTIEMYPSSTGDISGGAVSDYPFSSMPMTAPVPVGPSFPTADAQLPLSCSISPYCPDYNYNHTSISDPAWGLTFPLVFTPLWPMGSGSLTLYGVPSGPVYNMVTFNSLSGIYAANGGVSVLPGMSVSNPVSLNFTGYHDPAMSFSPASFPRMNPMDTASVYVYASGGWGISDIDPYGSSCYINGYVPFGPGVWRVDFEAPSMSSCYIYVEAFDCGCGGNPNWGPNMAHHSVDISINYSGWGW
jgi:hypothetical protein